QRIDVTQTVLGEHTLAAWLGRAATPAEIRARQAAVMELVPAIELRQELEASALRSAADAELDAHEKLDGRRFAEFAALPSYFEAHPWLAPVTFALPALTLLGYLLGQAGVMPSALWLLPFAAQVILLVRTADP